MTIEDRIILLLKEQLNDVVACRENDSGDMHRIRSIWTVVDESCLGGHGFWERLHGFTGISAQRWRKAFMRRQRSTPDMIEALARAFPQYAFWIATGITDATNGHIAPANVQGFPERLCIEDPASTSYFRHALTLMRRLFEEGRVNVNDEQERVCAQERMRPRGHGQESALCDAAYRISRSGEYARLEALWHEREKARRRRIVCITGRKRAPAPAKGQRAARRYSPASATVDPRSVHQDPWDLFYQPTPGCERTRFALDILNTAPSEVSSKELATLKHWLRNMQDEDFFVFMQYLEFHGLDRHAVFQPVQGHVRYASDGLSDDEVSRFLRLVHSARRTLGRSRVGGAGTSHVA